MATFLTHLVGRLADRWLTLLALPGLMFVGTVSVAASVGHRHWADSGVLTNNAERILDDVEQAGTIAIALLLVGCALAAVAAGLIAEALGAMIQRLWLTENSRLLAGWLTLRRRRRWEAADRSATEARDQNDEAGFIAHSADRNRIAWSLPSRPTWMADRIAATEARVIHEYGLDLRSAWPRLWLLVSEEARTEVRALAERLHRAAVLAAWGALYMGIAVWWWPSLIVGGVALGTGWARGRSATDTLADLIESVVDIHFNDLANALRIPIPTNDAAGPDVGRRITAQLRKGA